jgi:nitroreductase
MKMEELVCRCRSYRRFRQSRKVALATLRELVDLARQSASAMNLQPLRYHLAAGQETNARIFPHLTWAGYLKDWPGPDEGERPSAYIVVAAGRDSGRWTDCDLGIAAQSILLGAVERGLGGCMVASVNREALAEALGIPDDLKILLVIAIGEPAEQVVIDPLGEDGGIRYWRDENGTHHVPKRSLEEIILNDAGK